MARKKAGIQGPGLERLRRNLEEIQNETAAIDSWVIGRPSEKNKEFGEEIARENDQYKTQIATQRVQTLPDLWPSRDNYYKGPYRSTRVSAHRYVPNRLVVPEFEKQLGTVYVQFTNMRPSGKIRREDVYAYYDVPLGVYERFSHATSKGQFINKELNNYEYKNLAKEKKVFTDFD